MENKTVQLLAGQKALNTSVYILTGVTIAAMFLPLTHPTVAATFSVLATYGGVCFIISYKLSAVARVLEFPASFLWTALFKEWAMYTLLLFSFAAVALLPPALLGNISATPYVFITGVMLLAFVVGYLSTYVEERMEMKWGFPFRSYLVYKANQFDLDKEGFYENLK